MSSPFSPLKHQYFHVQIHIVRHHDLNPSNLSQISLRTHTHQRFSHTTVSTAEPPEITKQTYIALFNNPNQTRCGVYTNHVLPSLHGSYAVKTVVYHINWACGATQTRYHTSCDREPVTMCLYIPPSCSY